MTTPAQHVARACREAGSVSVESYARRASCSQIEARRTLTVMREMGWLDEEGGVFRLARLHESRDVSGALEAISAASRRLPPPKPRKARRAPRTSSRSSATLTSASDIPALSASDIPALSAKLWRQWHGGESDRAAAILHRAVQLADAVGADRLRGCDLVDAASAYFAGVYGYPLGAARAKFEALGGDPGVILDAWAERDFVAARAAGGV